MVPVTVLQFEATGHQDMEDDKPFVCSQNGCGQQFTNEDHLAVHMRKHEMSLALNLQSGSTLSTLTPGRSPGRSPCGMGAAGLFLDQTPTPTKFLRNCEEIGLFQELKNPFEEAFKKALDTDGIAVQPNSPFPGPSSNELNTPIPHPTPKILNGIKREKVDPEDLIDNDNNIALNLTKLKTTEPTSTTDDDSDVMVMSVDDQNKTTEQLVPVATGPSPGQPVAANLLVTAAQSTTVSPPKTTIGVATPVIQPPQFATCMQVFLQLPSGQTVPVQIPATITNPGIQTINNPGVQNASNPGVQTVAPGIQTITNPGLQTQNFTNSNVQNITNTSVQTLMNPGVQIIQGSPGLIQKIPTPAAVTPSSGPSPSVSPAPQSMLTNSPVKQQPSGSGLAQSSLTKQRLKAALQQQTVPSPGSQKVSSPATRVIQMSPDLNTANQITVISSTTNYAQGLSLSPMSETSVSIASDASSPDTDMPLLKRIKKDENCSDDRRVKFLERNRAAAARCRQKRKHWITNLERKGDELQMVNNRLMSEINGLKSEVAQLKTVLLTHKDCSVTVQQKSQGQFPYQAFSMLESTVPSMNEAGVILETDASGTTTGTSTATWVTASAPTVIKTAVSTATASSISGQKTITIIPKVIRAESTKPIRKK
ncbi:cyclic AMP-dependent transcription factor ATF-2-like isoform X1 [Mizuhopecten yessoensis]|uniref:cyclic AMP-dependent transcription factor ATF-2-like isoform X1 n=1 Tax=Mizuhopecten yessoensis TaxID=6573 RepID=UPI000B45DDF4|nr:cyclic AMP-dependent transcription factor ATF-2-like isoform X1 [Mizuhopecten yessoensis]